MRKKKKFSKKDIITLFLFSGLFLFSIIIIAIEIPSYPNLKIFGHLTSTSTVSNVTISKYLSIDMSTNLSEGILFGNVTSLPATNLNASHNYDGTSSVTTMHINVSADSNTNVDFCIKSNDDMIYTAGGERIGIGNETYANATTTSSSVPDLTKEVSLNKTDYIKAGENVNEGAGVFFRFWLDIPSAQAAGTYNNTINFKGVEVTTACGT